MDIYKIKEEYGNLIEEIDKVLSMTDEMICSKFNVDYKEEYLSVLNEEKARLERVIDELDEFEGLEEACKQRKLNYGKLKAIQKY